MFGMPPPQNEQTVFQPQSPYAAAKLPTNSANTATLTFVCNGFLQSNAAPWRTFVTKKVTEGVANILAGR
jgi:GDPmannose 4,6-dehydratase